MLREGDAAGALDGARAAYGGAMEMTCSGYGSADGATLWHLALDTPAAQQFWRQHPRIRALRFNSVRGAIVKHGSSPSR